MKTALIIGGGFSGCAAAHQLEMFGGWDVTLVESAPYLGAGVRTQWFGGHPYTFGPRHFLTPYEETFTYLNAIVPIRRCPEHEFLTYVERDNAFYAFPINMTDVRTMPDYNEIQAEMDEKKREEFRGAREAKNIEDYWIGSVGQRLYDKFIDEYSKKMWLIDDNKKIDTFGWSPKGVALKDGPRAAWDSAISGYPYAPDGYDYYFGFATQAARVLLSTTITNFDIPNKTVTFNGEKKSYDIIINTIAPDTIFDECYGALPFLGREFHKIVFPTESVLPENVYFLYYANDEKFTRLVEYKKFTHHVSPTTLIGMEIPTFGNGKHYPMPYQSEQIRAERYFAEMPEGVFSIGRAGSYLYGIDIDDCIRQTMLMAETLRGGGQDHPVPGENYRFPELQR
jgi:UDP-galactopyranose mutase